ncbi:MAG TPA: RelA/SpoT domain-containing protein, partial [Pseudobdellovibrionaceae bacterium]
MESNFKHTAENVRRDIEAILDKVCLLCRVFARGKDDRSLTKKLHKDEGKYSLHGKLIQDAIGVRVALYFEEDVDIVAQLLSSEFEIDNNASTVDTHATDQFTVTRHNLIFRLPEYYISDMQRSIGSMPIDTTFEVQLRSILSEGWHEVDHDLRYKSKSSWNGNDDLSRALNGILATIETAEWGMRRIFDDLAYRHYKKKNWETM